MFLCGSQVVFSSAVFHDTIKNHVYKEIGYQKKYIDAKKVAEFNGNESAVQMILEDLAKDDTK